MNEHRASLSEDLGVRESAPGARRSHRRNRRSYVGCLVALVLLGLVAGVVWIGLTRGVEWAKDFFAEAEDYPGPGSGSVLVEVQSGDTATDIGQTLEDQDVVASVEAFIEVANARPDDARGIQVGFYEMRKQMSAEEAFDILVDPANILTTAVTIPEGFRVVDVVDRLVQETKFGRGQFERVLDAPRQLGLPAYANGNPEGYLFPATYAFSPRDTPRTMLKQMVDRWQQAADDVGLEDAAQGLGYTPHELMTVASLIEAEARAEYMPQVARVIYNRLETDGDPTYGKLQLDATVNYATGSELNARTTAEDRQFDSPYNTYLYAGLPPGPIEAPGEAAMEAAAEPADGDWFFYVTVNLRTGETKFAETLEDHNRNVGELNEYCRNESERC